MLKIFEKERCTKFCDDPITIFHDAFDHFSRACEVLKSSTIKLHLRVSDVIHANEKTKYINFGLHVNFLEFFVNVNLFHEEKGSF